MVAPSLGRVGTKITCLFPLPGGKAEFVAVSQAVQEAIYLREKYLILIATLNNDRGPTRAEYFNTTITFLEKKGQNNRDKLQEKWFFAAGNVTLTDGSKKVCRLKQTCTPTGAARKYITTITDVFLLFYAVGLDVARVETQIKPKGCGLANYLLIVCLYNDWQSLQISCLTSEKRLTVT